MRRDYVSVEEAIALPGLRIAFSRGVPGPWGESARAMFDIKGIDYTPVIQEGGSPNAALAAWTGQNSAPCAMYRDERPRAHWSEILLLAERLGPAPRLLPEDEDERIAMFGIAHTLCGEDGFGWSARLLTFEVIESLAGKDALTGMRRKFNSAAPLEHAKARIRSVLQALERRMQAQRAAGSDFLVGRALSAADIYWAAFSNMLAPMEHALCPMPDYYRAWIEGCIALAGVTVAPLLIEHRERIVRTYFPLPMWF